MTWQDHANCLGLDPELFFPPRGQDTNEAKRICAGCSVREECLEHAITFPERFGIWGGTNNKTRQRLRAARMRRVA